MKKLATAIAAIALIGTPAFAADMAVKAPPAAPAPVPTWTGFYGGIQFGGAWSDEAVNYSPNDPAAAAVLSGNAVSPSQPAANGYRIPQSGPVDGFEAGYNWQAGSNWLVGVEADLVGPAWTAKRAAYLRLASVTSKRQRPSRARIGMGLFVGGLAGSRHQTCCCSPPAALPTAGWTVQRTTRLKFHSSLTPVAPPR